MKKPASFHTVTSISAGSAVARSPSQLGPGAPNNCITWAIRPYCGV